MGWEHAGTQNLKAIPGVTSNGGSVLGSVPMAENMSAYLAIRSLFLPVVWISAYFDNTGTIG
jgi:hypothetical protein